MLMTKHWVLKNKKLTETKINKKFEIPKGKVVTGKERDEILSKFDKWKET